MMKRLQEISLAGKTKPGIDADWADRIAGGVGTSLIVAFAILIGAKQYFGTVIDCWTPAEFAGPMDTYVSEFCFINRYERINKAEKYEYINISIVYLISTA